MAQSELPTPPDATGPMRRPVRFLLIGSLALNLLVLGLVAGAIFRGPDGLRAPRGVDLALGPIVQALAPEDREAIRAELRNRDALQLRPRRDRDALARALLIALRAETFDPAAIEAALSVPRDRALAVERAVQQSLLDRIAAMTPAGRAAFADRLAEEMAQHGDDRDDSRTGGDGTPGN